MAVTERAQDAAVPGIPAGLHARWDPDAGLLVWSPEQGRVRFLARALGRRSPRHRVRIPSVCEDGFEALAFSPDAARDLLRPSVEDVPSASGAADAAPDFEYLSSVLVGVRRWVAAGLVAPELRRIDGQWSPLWSLLGTAGQRAWRAEWIAAMPPVVAGEGAPSAVFDDFVDAMSDSVVRGRVAGPRPAASHPLLAALVDGEPVSENGAEASGHLAAWREGARRTESEMVLRLVEPPDSGAPSGDAAADTPAGSARAVGDEELWRLEVCVRADGAAPAPLELVDADRETVRRCLDELAAAAEAYPLLRELPRAPDSLDMLLPEAAVTDLVRHGGDALSEAGMTVLLPRVWRVAEPEVRVHVSSPELPASSDETRVGIAQLVEFDMEVALGDTVLERGELDELARRGTDLVKVRGEWMQADARAIAAASRYLSARRGDPATLASVLRMLATDPPPVPLGAVSASGWVEALFGGAPPADRSVTVPEGLRAHLRDYQVRGLTWLAYMADMGLGCLLADDMGLGKTVQVLALELLVRRDKGVERPTLVVCPMSVVGNWEREAERFAPGLRIHVHHGPGRPRGDRLTERAAASDVILTTYVLLAKDIEELRGLGFERVVLDEAQHIKNERTAQARAARKLEARHRVALTGTPVENRVAELRAILDFANPGMLGSPAKFRAAFSVPIETGRDRGALRRLRELTAPFVLRRAKTDPAVAPDLPDKQEMTVRVNLTAEQATLYQSVLDDLESRLGGADGAQGMERRGLVLTTLVHLKQVCNHPAHYLADGSSPLRRGVHRSGKLALVEDIVGAILDEKEKVLLFTQFREFGAIVAPWLAGRFGLAEVPFLHGGVPRRAREDMLDRFRAPEGPPVMVLSLKAGGTGLNLDSANHVVHLDRWWNPAVENQATDRAFRIGQQRDVQVRKLVSVGTLEERIDAMIAGKREVADLSVGHGEAWVTELDDAALRSLVALGREARGE